MKILRFILITTLVLSFSVMMISCGKNETPANTEIPQNTGTVEANKETAEKEDKENKDNKKDKEDKDEKDEEKKEEEKKEDKKEPVKNEEPKKEEPKEEKPAVTPAPQKPAEPATPTLGENGELPEGVTFANYLFSEFKSIVNKNSSASAEEIANELSQSKAIMFFSMASPVEEGYIPGFDNDITGFKSGAMFGPAMGSIPFVGYVFELADASAANAFVSTLTQNANPRWQICVTAEETVCKAVGNKVFFVMAPRSNQ